MKWQGTISFVIKPEIDSEVIASLLKQAGKPTGVGLYEIDIKPEEIE